jgi:hypothetical protein
MTPAAMSFVTPAGLNGVSRADLALPEQGRDTASGRLTTEGQDRARWAGPRETGGREGER